MFIPSTIKKIRIAGAAMSVFDHVQEASIDPILGLNAIFFQDNREFKVNLTAGVYKDEHMKTPVMHAVRKSERNILLEERSKEYLPIEGDLFFLQEVARWLFGNALWQKLLDRTSSFQAIGGTGALKVGADFLKKELHSNVYVSTPTWPNHYGIFSQAGHVVESYPYYDMKTNSLLFSEIIASLKKMPKKSVVLFHASCHNPSGLDLSIAHWEEIASICKDKELVPFFDAAYLGFGGTIDHDAMAIRLFAEKEIEMLIAVSFSKNFSLYGERVGALYILSKNEKTAKNINGQVKILIRRNYSSPPLHSAKIVREILKDDHLKKLWEDELCHMRERINGLKKEFSTKLINQITSKDYQYLLETKGMFCFCGLEKEAVETLMKEHAVYMTYDGRINAAGLSANTIDYVVDAIKKVVG
jgi:aromatic-amino-acid transaminase